MHNAHNIQVFCLLMDRIMDIEIESDIKPTLRSFMRRHAMTMNNNNNEIEMKPIRKQNQNITKSLNIFVGFSSLNLICFYFEIPFFYTVFRFAFSHHLFKWNNFFGNRRYIVYYILLL